MFHVLKMASIQYNNNKTAIVILCSCASDELQLKHDLKERERTKTKEDVALTSTMASQSTRH